MNPWASFLTNAAVKAKIANFNLIRGNLNVKVTINGTPFHYGALRAWYHPYGYNNSGATHTMKQTYLQHPGFILEPSGQTSAEIVLPFVSMNNWIDLSPTGYSDHLWEAQGSNLGRLVISTLSPLKNANTLAATTVYVTVYAWMTEVELAVPTPYPQLESKGSHSVKKKKRKSSVPDEYEAGGTVSTIASSVADVAGRLKDVPFIGEFAKATEMGADALGTIASLFGWAKPTVITQPNFIRPSPFAYFAQSDAADMSSKLALDTRNEVTVDPSAIGMPARDSLVIYDILQRDSYCTSFDFATTDLTDIRLARIPVTPCLYSSIGIDTKHEIIPSTPMWYLAKGFCYWTGTIKYKIRIFATKYHRGRLRISYMPRDAAIVPAVEMTNVTWNTLVDISEDCEVEFEVPWCQKVPWMRCADVALGATDNYGRTNGEIDITVINRLSTPTDSGSIPILVTASAGDDFRFAKPYTQGIQNYTANVNTLAVTPAAWTSGLGTQVGTPMKAPTDYLEWTAGPAPVLESSGSGDRHVEDNSHFVDKNFGESIVSLRPLLKRAEPYINGGCKHQMPFAGWTGLVLPQLPFDLTMVADGAGSYPFPVNDLTPTNISVGLQTHLTWFKSCFLAARGSVRYKASYSSLYTAANTEPNDNYHDMGAWLVDNYAPNLGGYDYKSFSWSGGGGEALTCCATSDGLEIEVPYYFNRNFTLANTGNNMSYGIDDAVGDISSNNSACLALTHRSGDLYAGDTYNRHNISVAGGDDFTLDWFIAAPPVIHYIGANGRMNPERT